MGMNVVGYVRLSRDDDKKNYMSIENQKSLIQKYAKENQMKIDEFYEDDGVSGYIFDRPSFQIMLNKLEAGEIDVIIAKDLSRIGRNNAKVLLLLDQISQLGKRLILIDDRYDTFEPEDDIIGIKTWYNERYVKDASKKIRSVISMKQKDGDYIVKAPFGYGIDDSRCFVILEDQSEVVKLIFDLYLNGYGYRNISLILHEKQIPTPSIMIRDASKKKTNKPITNQWSDTSVRDILKNDFYIGNYRTHKRARKTIHGNDARVPKEEQYVFENHHEPIISLDDFNKVQEIMEKRTRTHFRIQKYKDTSAQPLSSVLYCDNCGSKMVLIKRKTTNGIREYYLCSNYNTKGKRYCPKSHLINKEDIEQYFKQYMHMCIPVWEQVLNDRNKDDYETKKSNMKRQLFDLRKNESELSLKLKSIIKLKMNDLMKNPDNESIIEETYGEMQEDITSKIKKCRGQIEIMNERLQETHDDTLENVRTGILFANNIISDMNIKNIEQLVEKITIDENGIPNVILYRNLNDYAGFNIADIINSEENMKIKTVFEIISQEQRSYTSARYISDQMNKKGYSSNKKSILPYINLAIGVGVLKETGDLLKPYEIIADKSMVLEYAPYLH